MPRLPEPLLRIDYEESAEAYLRGLPLEHFMEAISQSTQRAITVVAFMLLHARRFEVQYFSELLVQYDYGRPAIRRQVVPDNMVIVHPETIEAEGSYDIP